VDIPAIVAGEDTDGLPALADIAIRLAGAIKPVFVILDDAQLADATTLRWLADLCRRIRRQRVAVLLSVCHGEPSSEDAVLNELFASATAREVLEPFSVAAVSRLMRPSLGSRPDPAFVERCFSTTGGVASLVVALADIVRADAVARTDARHALAALSQSQAGTRLRTQIREVSKSVFLIATATATLNEFATAERVAHVADLDHQTADHAIGILARMGLLSRNSLGIALVPPILQQILATEVATPEWHVRAAVALHEAGADPKVVAEHLLLAPPTDLSWAPELLSEQACRAGVEGNSDLAVAYLRQSILSVLRLSR
jgi:hypothetical protein